MSKMLTVLALATAVCWPTAAWAAKGEQVPARGLSKAEVRAQFGEPERTRPAVGQPPISRWDYNGFSVYFENDTTLHSVREQGRRAPTGDPAGDSAQPAHASAEAGTSPANGEEPPAVKEEQENQIEMETYNRPSAEDREKEKEAGTESDSTPGSTAVRAKADNADADTGDEDKGRFKFDPATGRIMVTDGEADNNDARTSNDQDPEQQDANHEDSRQTP